MQPKETRTELPRRGFLRGVGAAAALGSSGRHLQAQQAAERASRGMPSPKITDVSVIATQPAGTRLVVVKVTTDQPGLYGYGCATFTQRAEVVIPAVEKYLKPLLVGRPTDRIDDTWQMMYNGSYWRNGPVLNNAISGVDQALWDIKGRQCGVPVYQLLGGKCREAADLYVPTRGNDAAGVVESIQQQQAGGYRHFRITLGERDDAPSRPERTLHNDPVYSRAGSIRHLFDVLEGVRTQLGDEPELLHDIHEKITPSQALQVCRDLERFRMFFIEDPLSPEDLAYYRIIRQQSTTPIAMGELFNSPHEWLPLISERLIDYIRVHVSQAGGVTPCRKMAILGEHFGVRTAWHGPGDCSPIGHSANLTLSVSAHNFGIQEIRDFNDATREVFDGCPVVKNGYGYANEAPGWGIEVNEQAAAKYPYRNDDSERGRLNGGWGPVRLPDGTLIKQ